MYGIGEKIIYSESGVCVVEKIAPLEIQGASAEKLFYHLKPVLGSGMFFAPVEGAVYMRSVMTADEANAFIDTIPGIAPAICDDNRFNHVDAFFKNLFKLHSCEALISVIKGLKLRAADRKTKSSRADATMKRAKEILYGELSVSLGIAYEEVENYILQRTGKPVE